ncbi:1-aminocyclopropane-1-carboxylate deaminase [Coniochaeta sp. 2T2.1]|nr:1-aminocyclopropane-1-carboxylate deaminase [Coniochaeta sp. 2T2.1]
MKLPEPFASLPRQPLLFPTASPIEPLHRLTARLAESGGNLNAIFVKREDANSGLGGGGGNKLRKLEYVLADALAQTPKPTRIVTEGGIQSNHVRQVTAAAAKLGLEAVLLIADLVPERTADSNGHKAQYEDLGNVQLTRLMSATHVDASEAALTRETLLQDGDAYWIPSGASTHPLGGLGYARWAFEVEEQEREMGTFFDVIVVALMSGSTLAGMVAGLKLAAKARAATQEGDVSPRKRRVIGVQAGPKDSKEMRQLVLQIARTTARKIGVDEEEITEDDFEIDSRWHAGAYGRLDERTRDSIKLAASMEGLITDPVYSGKALTAVCEMARTGEVQGNVLFVHTGGVLTLSAYPDLR